MSDQIALFIDFENIAIWAEQEFFNFELSQLMEHLKSRGPVVVKRAYADWTRFRDYRSDMLDNAIDLIQLYSVRAGKNRADIRMALDAFETGMNHERIQTMAIVSGDSDFGPLVSKLREYGKYVVGIGPRSITHPLLIKSCDEFVYLETIIGDLGQSLDGATSDVQEARELLVKALAVFGQSGELPVLAAKLKQKMLAMNPAFSEANLGYDQYSSWLEDHGGLVKLYFKDLQLYVAPTDFAAPSEFELSLQERETAAAEPATAVAKSLESQYRRLYKKTITADLHTRRDVLRDIYRELNERPGQVTPGEVLEQLQERYERQGLIRSRSLLLKIWQMGFYQRAYDYLGESATFQTPVQLADDIGSEADFVRRAESRFLYAVTKSGLPVDKPKLAAVLLEDPEQTEYIDQLLADLQARDVIAGADDQYHLKSDGRIPFEDEPALRLIQRDILQFDLPDRAPSGPDAAAELARKASLQRSQDFVAAARNYLAACRLQADAIRDGHNAATLDDLRWFMASYASAKAGELSQVDRDYGAARPYYLAFFALVQEDDPLWERMRGLINPMLSYYWVNLAREMDIFLTPDKAPANIAALLATHENAELRRKWQEATRSLAQSNPGLLQRIVDQLELGRAGGDQSAAVARQILEMLRG